MPGPDQGLIRQSQVYLAGVLGRRPAVAVSPERLEEAARRAMSPEGFAYVAGGAGSESTVRANRSAFGRWAIVPRVLRDVSARDTSVDLFGRKLPSPLLLSPIGVLEMARREAELAVCRAVSPLGVPVVFSNQASTSIEECVRVMGASPRWFQLYWSKSDELAESFLRRAESCGCDAVVVTLDTTMLGWRPRDLELGYLPFLRGKGIAQYVSDPVFLKSLATVKPRSSRRVNVAALKVLVQMARRFPGGFLRNIASSRPRAAVQQFVATYSRPSLTWEDLKRLRAMTRLPVVLKGILHADDARRALDSGVDGIMVSNHGGRQVDGAIASLDALPSVVGAVRGQLPVLFDSGIQGGADIFKALALGARAVGIGRPYVYGLAVAGEVGVSEVIRNFMADFELTMGLAGCRSVAEITRDCIAQLP